MGDWFKFWPIVVAFVGLIGWGYTIRADVDRVEEAIGPPGSLPVIQFKVDELGKRIERVEGLIEKQEDERDKMLDVIRSGQEKIDSLIELLRERQEIARPRIKPSFPPNSSSWGGLAWS